jgi:hypothetical protein
MAKDSKEKTQEPTKKVSWEMSQDQRSRINSLWNKLQQSENTKFITEGGKADLSPAAQENIMRQNINKYADANLNNNINSVGMGMKVDKNFAKLSPKEAKVIEFASKALDALDKVKDYSAKNPRPYDKVDSYLKQIDNIDKPGLLKKAAIAAGNIGSDLIKKLGNRLPSLPNNNKGKKEERTR